MALFVLTRFRSSLTRSPLLTSHFTPTLRPHLAFFSSINNNNNNNNNNNYYYNNEPLLSEELYGRKRIYHADTAHSGRLIWRWQLPQATRRFSLLRLSFVASARAAARAMFLPINYPQSVHSCYLPFHQWQAMETYVGAVVGVLCNQAMLESLGLSQAAATAGAVAIQWVLKDGIAEIGKLLFIKRYARSFDSHPKTWKAIGEVLTTVGSGLQLCTLLVPPDYFLALAATGNIAKSISWALWGATHNCFIRNFALSNNVGDLTAKADSQGAFALISGWLSGIILISISHTPSWLFGVYFLFAPLHAISTYKLLTWANFEVLNEAKTSLIVRHYLEHGQVPSMMQIKPYERFFGEFVSTSVTLPTLELGVTAEQAFQNANKVYMAIRYCRGENYLLGFDPSRFNRVAVVLHREAEGRDALKAVLHAVKFHEMLSRFGSKELSPSSIKMCLQQSHLWMVDHFPQFVAKLDTMGWQSESVLFSDPGYRADWKRMKRDDDAIIEPDILTTK